MASITNCPNCDHQNLISSLFCSACGESIQKLCSQCSKPLSVNANYCNQCGSRVVNAESDTDTSYTDEQLALERRQMTVMFCDLRNFTKMSNELEDEDLRRVLMQYQDRCAMAISKYGGYISRYMGDGVLALFGYPLAHDDDAYRAVLASIKIVNDVSNMKIDSLGNTTEFSVRVGIATGIVISGDVIGDQNSKEHVVVGKTPNLASRLQTSAETNKILISEKTYRLVRHRVNCELAGQLSLKGFSSPINAYQVTEPAKSIEAYKPRKTRQAGRKIIDRSTELSCLLHLWSKTKQQTGGIVVLQGEAGIGKSRLKEEIIMQTQPEPHYILESQCSSFSNNSTLHPIFGLLRGNSRQDLDAYLQQIHKENIETYEKAKQLVSIISEADKVNSGHFAHEKVQIEQPYYEIIQLLILLSTGRPLLFVIEDCHWADPSTLELLKLCLNQLSDQRILVVITARSEFKPDWLDQSDATLLNLERFDYKDTAKMVKERTQDAPFPESLCDIVVEKSDGVPLFVEELTLSILEQQSSSSHKALDNNFPDETTIPDTLRDLLMSRLDQSNDAKVVAQIGATIGKEFSYELLACISQIDQEILNNYLSKLIDAELIYETKSASDRQFTFKHHLIQDTAYDSLVSTRKAEYHKRIANALENQFGDIGRTKPELLARHFELSGQYAKAVEYMTLACERSLQQSANLEALSHARHGLYCLSNIDTDYGRRDELMLSLYIHLVTAISGTKGDADPELEVLYEKAEALSARLKNKALDFQLTNNRRAFYQIRGPISAAIKLGKKMISLAEKSGDRHSLMDAHRCLGWAHICHGDFSKGGALISSALSIYNKRDSSTYTRHDTIDPGAVGAVNLSWSEWFLGNTAEAVRLSNKALSLSRKINHSYTLSYALCMSAAVYQCNGDARAVLPLVDEALDVAEKRGYRYWLAWGSCLKGWALSQMNNASSDGINMLEQGLAEYRSTGATLFVPHILCMLAESLIKFNRHYEAYEALQDAMATEVTGEVFFFAAETQRLAAIAMAKLGESGSSQVHFNKALGIATNQKAVSCKNRTLASMREFG